MSLPTAPKDISTNPAKGSVVDPVNRAIKDADVDRKTKIYDAVQALRQGHLPDNKQIDDVLNYLTSVNVDKLSAEGKKVVQDTRDIVETERKIVSEKNNDELFQNFVWHTRDIDPELPGADVTATPDSQQAVKHLRTILSLILTNSEVRKLLSDFSLTSRDLLSYSATKVADTLRPDPEALARVDQPAPQSQFIKRTVGPTQALGKDHTAVQDIGATINEEAKSGNHEDHEKPSSGAADSHINGVDSERGNKGFMSRVKGFRNDLSHRFPQELKDKVNSDSDNFSRGKQVSSEEYFPESRRDQFIFRGKKVIIECQKHNDYQESIQWLLSYAENYASHITGHVQESGTAITSDRGLKKATSELCILLERFANNKSMDTIFDAVNALIDDANHDQNLQDWFKSFHAYVRKILLDAGYVLEPDCNSHGKQIRESGLQFYDGKYKTHFDTLFSSVGDWFKAMGDDPLNKRFGEDWARLTRDLLFDDEGSLKFKKDLWNDIRKVIVPTLVDKVGYIPIPRVEFTDDNLDIVVENLTLSGRNLFPNYLTLEAHNFIKFSPYSTIEDAHHHEVTLTFAQMQADMRDVAFYFNFKKGIIKRTVSGIADVVLGGSGLTAKVHLVSANKDKSSVFKIKRVQVKVDTLKFSMRDTEHDIIYNIIGTLATKFIKKQIQKAIKDSITTGLEYVDGQLVSVRDRMEAAKVTEGQSRTQVLQDLFAKKKEDSSTATTKGHSSSSKSQFKIIHNKRDSVLSEGHPSGWVSRGRAESNKKRDSSSSWRSDAFTINSFATSSASAEQK